MTDHRHISRLTWGEALDLVDTVNGELGGALRGLTKPSGKPVFHAEYRYGDIIVEREGTLRPPCSAPTCQACAELKEACAGELPFALVGKECCEVRFVGPSQTAPLRLLREGESFGIFELLDTLYPSPWGGVQQPPWQVVAGAKSVHITSPFCTQPLGKSLRRLLPPDIIERVFPKYTVDDKKVSQRLKDNPYLFVRFLEKAALQSTASSKPWTASVLIFPSKMLVPVLRKSGAFVASAKDLLLQIHGTAWVQSRNLRTRDVEAAEIEQHLSTRTEKDKHLLSRTIQRVLAISRGDLPAFVPYSSQHMAGPFSTVQDFFLSSKLNEKLAQPTFPAILQPCHLGDEAHQSRFGYFSLSVPSVIGLDHESFDNELADDLVGILRKSKFGQNVRISLHTSLKDDDPFHNDFAYQFEIAQEKWHVSPTDFFGDFKQGFTLRFIRVERDRTTAAEPRPLQAVS